MEIDFNLQPRINCKICKISLSECSIICHKCLPQWISVEDMLPAVHRHVIIYMPNVEDTPEFSIGYLENDLNFYYLEKKENIEVIDMDLVTHWMPLPEPPK